MRKKKFPQMPVPPAWKWRWAISSPAWLRSRAWSVPSKPVPTPATSTGSSTMSSARGWRTLMLGMPMRPILPSGGAAPQVRDAVPPRWCSLDRAGRLRSGQSRSMVRAAAEGRLLEDGSAGYDDARTVWNAMADRRPRAILRCASAEDVAEAIRYGRERGLEIGVRCGAHSVLGLCVPDDGLMIDLSPMGRVRVDPERRRAWVQGGALLGALDRAAMEHGLTTTAGNVSHTGVGGLTLGGGMGWLARQFGLSCDNVAAYELITADGERLRVDQDADPELFWGLRGGGGNFGIVTEFEFRLHPVARQAHLVELFFPVEDAAPVMRGWRDLNAIAPRAATFTAWVGESRSPFLPPEWHDRPVANVGFV